MTTATHDPTATSPPPTMAAETVFYDIASAKPERTFAPNPWKTRFALNYKGIPYRTEWVDMPDIGAVRQRLGVAANRTLPDGSPFYTLPILHDGGKLVGDTFEIALHLDEAYPDAPRLFHPKTIGLTAAFNAQVDSLFTKYALFADQMPFPDPDAVKAVFAKRFGVPSLDVLQPSAEQREKMLVEFEAALGELAKAYRHTGGTTDHVWRAGGTAPLSRQHAPAGREEAVFLDGDEPSYADFIVGAWLKMFECAAKAEEWQRIRSFQGGLWGRIVDALDRWTEIK